MLIFQIILQIISLCNTLEKNVHSSLTISNIQYEHSSNPVLLRTLKTESPEESSGSYKSLGIILNSDHMISKIHAYFYS